MEEEFQESDVLWPEFDRRAGEAEEALAAPAGSARRQKTRTTRTTPAVRIADPPATRAAARSWTVGFAYPSEDDDSDEDGSDGGGGRRCVIPPHVIVGRRIADDRVAFSVCVGNGRTLKGRDLSHVRNSVLRMTGFLEI